MLVPSINSWPHVHIALDTLVHLGRSPCAPRIHNDDKRSRSDLEQRCSSIVRPNLQVHHNYDLKTESCRD